MRRANPAAPGFRNLIGGTDEFQQWHLRVWLWPLGVYLMAPWGRVSAGRPGWSIRRYPR